MTPADGPLASEPPAPGVSCWSLGRRVGFRFAFCYFLLFALPSPFSALPWMGWTYGVHAAVQAPLTRWVGEHLLELPGLGFQPNGSGDQMADYVWQLVLLLAAMLMTVAWSLMDRRRRDYRMLHHILRVCVRMTLALAMLSYGFAKVFKSQFPSPAEYRLTETFGDSSPMGLLWTFMGYSTPYTMFSGAMEVLGGVLLFARRTTTLGALVLACVLTNIVMLNLCYDVPVKLYSMNLLAMSLFLLLPDGRRLFSVLVLNRAAPPADLGPVPLSARGRRVLTALGALFVVLTALPIVAGAWTTYRMYGDGSDSALEGIYLVDSPDAPAWTQFVITTHPDSTWAIGKRADGTLAYYRLERAVSGALTLAPSEVPTTDALVMTPLRGRRLRIEGTLDGAPVSLRASAEMKHLLLSRGFHWVNEQPFNR